MRKEQSLYIPDEAWENRFFDAQYIQDSDINAIFAVIEWLSTAIQTDAEWLQDTDENGIPKRLLNIATFDDARQRANKAITAHLSRLQSNFNKDSGFKDYVEAGHIEVIKEFDDGYKIVQLLTPYALTVEAETLEQCMNRGEYKEKLKRPDVIFYSLRSPENKAVATLELIDGKLQQCEGRKNFLPEKRHIPYIAEFLKENQIKIGDINGRTGFAIVDGEYVAIPELPEGFTYEGNLHFSQNPWLSGLSKNLHVTGDLKIFSCNNFVIPPQGLIVEGDIFWQPKGQQNARRFNCANEFSTAVQSHIRDIRHRKRVKLDAVFPYTTAHT